MNANMKRLLIFALVPVTVWGIGSTFTKQKIDRIGVNTESQITMEDTTRFSSGTASTVPYLDASKDLVSSSVTPTELGYLSGVTSSIQTQIDSIQTPASGAGGSRLNLLDDSSFESGVANGSCTGCTATQDTTNYLATPNNEASLKMAFSAASGNYTWTESTSAQYSNVAGVVSAWIKTSASDCHFDELVDGTQSQTVAIGSSDEWKQYIINGTTGTTSYGWRVRCDTAITDDVFVDETFAGAAEPDTFDIGTASLWGSVKWDTTTTCEFSNSSSTFANYGQDLDCDDNARTIKGQYNSTNGSAGNSDGSYPQIKFSYVPAGTLKCEARGFFYAGATGVQFAHRFSDGTISSTNSTSYSSGGSNDLSGANYVEGSLTYDTPQTNVVINLQAKVTSNTGYIQLDNNGEEFEISCYHYPAPQKVVAASCSGLECENEFSARITNSAGAVAVATESVSGWIDSAAEGAPARVVVNYAGLGLGTAPTVLATAEVGTGAIMAVVESVSTTQAVIRTEDDADADTRSNFHIKVIRQGSDFNQFNSRFIPVNDPQDITVEAYGNGGQSITANSTDVTFNEVVDNQNAWNGSQFTAPKEGVYQVEGSIYGTSLAIRRIDGYINGGAGSPVGARTFSNGDVSSNVHKFSGQVRLNEGDVLSIRVNQTFTLNNANQFHWIAIKKLKEEQKAFIGNLTPKEFVQTPGSTKPVMYSAKISTSGTVSLEQSDWINGSVAITDTSLFTFTLESGVFSQEPSCVTVPYGTNPDAAYTATINSASSSSVVVRTGYTLTSSDFTKTPLNFSIICHGVQ